MAPSPQCSRGLRHSRSTTAISAISNEPKTDISSPNPKFCCSRDWPTTQQLKYPDQGYLTSLQGVVRQSRTSVWSRRRSIKLFQANHFCPTFIEVDDLSVPQKLTSLTEKFKGTYFFFGRREIGVAGRSTFYVFKRREMVLCFIHVMVRPSDSFGSISALSAM